MQLNPFPENPLLQAQLKLPIVLVQVAFVWHPPLLVKHSLISFIYLFWFIFFLFWKKKKWIWRKRIIIPLQLNPFPEYPVLQEHVKLPFVFKQFAFTLQLWVPNKHSLSIIHLKSCKD